MDYIIAIVLGTVQGLTEFLPISSDGHLFVIREIFNWPDQGLAFDAVLHLGTLVAIVVVLYRELWLLIRGVVEILKTGKIWQTAGQRLVVLVVISGIPAVLAGLFLEDLFANTYRNLLSVGLWLAATGSFYFLAEQFVKKDNDKKLPSRWDALWIGLAQLTALLPGVSRSGTTIAVGSLTGMTREASARYSFVMAVPILLGASGLSFYRLASSGSGEAVLWIPLLLGTVVAFIIGYLALRTFLRFLKTHTLRVFGGYLLGLGALIIILRIFQIW